jgi:hypothetical protein
MNYSLSDVIHKIPAIAYRARRILVDATLPRSKTFAGSLLYWEQRYGDGGNSGVGSYGKFAEFKAEMLNSFVSNHGIRTVIEFGCGDGNQLSLAKYSRFLGFDVSNTAINLCKKRFECDKDKTFKTLEQYAGETADLTLSLDVIYHLVEDDAFDSHMRMLFQASNQYVAIYSKDSNENVEDMVKHVRHRKFTDWIEKNAPEWNLFYHIPNRFPYKGDYKTGSWSDFFIYHKVI